MKLFRKARKKMAEEFVEDVKASVKEETKFDIWSLLPLVALVPMVLSLPDISVPRCKSSNFLPYIETLNVSITIKGGK